MIHLLKSHKILVCAGSGGIGKTTLSASLGVLAADSGLRTLVLTIDPAQRLAQAMGLESQPGVEVAVKGVDRLSALMIDPRREFDEFVLGSVDNAIAKGLFKNRLYQQLVSNLNGSQEFTSLLRLLNSVESGRYDLIILDTPPTQNAVDFLKAPDRLYALFQDSVIAWFASRPPEQEGFIRRALGRGTRLVTAALETLTGSVFIHELKDFFNHLTYLQGRVAQVSQRVSQLLHSPQTGFLLITGYDPSKLKGALEFQQDLKDEKLKLCGVVLNRWFPEWARGASRWPVEWNQDTDFQRLELFHSEFNHYFEGRQESFARFQTQVAGAVPIVKLLEFKQAVQGIEDLRRMGIQIQEAWKEWGDQNEF